MATQDYTATDNIVQTAIETSIDTTDDPVSPAPKYDVLHDEVTRYGDSGAPLPALVEEAYPAVVNADTETYEAIVAETRRTMRQLMVDGETTGVHLEDIEEHTAHPREFRQYRGMDSVPDGTVEVFYSQD